MVRISGILQDETPYPIHVVAHVPVADHADPPLAKEQLRDVEQQFRAMPKPLLLHCSAGVGRTGAVVAHLKAVLDNK